MTAGGDLRALLSPRSVAIVGASSKPGHFANQPIRNLLGHKFAGAVFPVNPSYDEVEGLPCYASLDDLPEVPDLVVVVVRPELAIATVRRAADIGAGAAVVVGSGFGETGSATGRDHQQALVDAVAGSALRVLGPNTLGVANFATGAVSYASGNIPDQPRVGGVAIVSQSGGCSFTLLNRAWRSGIGVGHVAVAGNEVDVTIPELITYYLDQPDVASVACYLEAIRDAPGLRAVARHARDIGKPVFVMKSGVSEAGSRAASAHTGALATSDDVCDSALADWGLPRACSFDELIGAAGLAAQFGPGAGHRFGVYAQGGGVAVVASDLFAAAGLPFAQITPEAAGQIRDLLPDTTPGNPFDSGGQFLSSGAALLTKALDIFNAEPDVSATVYTLIPVAGRRAAVYTEGIVNAAQHSAKPGIALQYGAGEITRSATDELIAAGIPVLDPPEAGVAALRLWSTARRPAGPAPRRRTGPDSAARAAEVIAGWRAAGRTTVSEYDARALLAIYGIAQARQHLVVDVATLASTLRTLPPPWVLKIASDDVPHRSDVGGVVLGLTDPEQAVAAFTDLLERVRAQRPHAVIQGVVVSETAPRGAELIVGTRYDPTFGPVVVLGAGGVDAELLQDSSLRLAPVTSEAVGTMIDELRLGAVLRGTRGRVPADLDALTDVVVRLAELAADLGPALVSVELNPVFAGPVGVGATAADALVELAGTSP